MFTHYKNLNVNANIYNLINNVNYHINYTKIPLTSIYNTNPIKRVTRNYCIIRI